RTIAAVALIVAGKQDSVLPDSSGFVRIDHRLAGALDGNSVAESVSDLVMKDLRSAHNNFDADSVFLMPAIGIIDYIAAHDRVIAVRDGKPHAFSVACDEPREAIILDHRSNQP